jgi:hypothetical protein
MPINTHVIILAGALNGMDGRITAYYGLEQQVEVEIDFLTSVITDASNVRKVEA